MNAQLGFLQTQQRRQQQQSQQYHGLYVWLVELVYMLLYFRHVQNVSYIEQRLIYYRGLADLAATQRPLWVFSLNHDVLVECIAAKYGVPVSAGFSETGALPCRFIDGSPAGELPIESRAISEIERQAFNFNPPGGYGINLIKIHGSLDVFVADDRKQLVRLLPRENTPAGIINALKLAHENLFYEVNGRRVKATNEIAYADRDGEMQFLQRSLLAGAYKFDKHGSQVIPDVMLKQFRATLNHVSELICLGYGFGDNHINDALRHWLEFSDDRRLVCVDPRNPSTPAFLAHVRPQVVCESLTATEYLERYSSIPLTASERAVRTMSRWARERQRSQKGFG